MYLSKVWINWHWAKDPYQLHRAIWQLFPGRPDDRRDFLFRVEDLQPGRGAAVLLQSQQAPVSAEVANVLASKEYSLLLTQGARLRFRLRCNPVKSIKDQRERLNAKGGVKSCRVPLIHEEEQLQWLVRKLDGAAQLETARVVEEQPLYFRKSDMGGKIKPVCFEGILVVSDAEQLKELIGQGIGPAKAMGCGMLSIAPA
ncbi:MAG: type I-E CRISPR-associated protein Cas6/Cse3/CasE [Saccharospirillaceae bacterium]|nr:type I-E CRISPR-associated protein Cas6/Cse3/CasE [Saccharospirillaceae bacterium]MCD8531795.1 type I-E CRISPR-associated protein Cas6/Cse3/CasE [Saccharospirillaceae bacterium]